MPRAQRIPLQQASSQFFADLVDEATEDKENVVAKQTQQVPAVPASSTAASLSLGSAKVPEDQVLAVLEKQNSAVWSERMECFRDLKRLVQSGGLSDRSFEKIVSCCIFHTLDPHYKVALESLQMINHLLVKHTNRVEQHLERLFPLIFKKIIDPKEQICNQALLILENVMSVSDPNVLTLWCIKLLDEANPKLKTAALEFVAQIVPKSSTLLHTRALLLKITPFLSDKNPELRKATLLALHSLNQHFPAHLAAQLPLLPVDFQVDLQRAVTIQPLPSSSSSSDEPESNNGEEIREEGSQPLPFIQLLDSLVSSQSLSAPSSSTLRSDDTENEAVGDNEEEEACNVRFPDVVLFMDLLNRLSLEEKQQKAALDQLTTVSRENEPTFWTAANFQQILRTVLASLERDDVTSLSFFLFCGLFPFAD